MLENFQLLFVDSEESPNQLFEYLIENGEILVDGRDPSNRTQRFCVKTGDNYWIWLKNSGGIRFRADDRNIWIYNSPDRDRESIRLQVLNHWLPYVYQLWGHQVIHGSSAYYVQDGQVAIFAGPTNAGKSTISYALGKLKGWQQLVDDSTAFTIQDSRIQLVEMPSFIRLRQPSAEYFNDVSYSHRPIEWPQSELFVSKIYFLEADDQYTQPEIVPFKKSLAYRSLLMQAYVLSENLTELNRQLLLDYLEFASRVPAAHLRYQKNLDALPALIEMIAEDFTQI